MPLWLRILIILMVDGIWALFMAPIVWHAITTDTFPLAITPLFSIPGITYALLSGRVIRIGREGLVVEKEEKKEAK